MSPWTRRQVLASAGAVAALRSLPARADAYPSRRVTLVVPFPPGGPVDVTARVAGERLRQIWGQPVLIENKGGADGVIGAQAVANAAPDGYTILVCSIHHSVHPSVKAKLPYDVEKAFVPVGGPVIFPIVLVANPSVPAKTVGELVAYAKQNPGRLTFASAGTGGGTHLAGELFKSVAGVEMRHIPHRGSAPAMTSVLGGHVDLMFSDAPTALPQIGSGAVRAFGVASLERTKLAPDLPTLAEGGLSAYEAYSWAGLLAPAQTPKDVVAKLGADAASVLSEPDVKERLARAGAEASPGTPDEFGSFFKAEMAKWARVVEEARIVMED